MLFRSSKNKNISRFEFVAMMALLMSTLALSIDAILPALATITSDLGKSATASNESLWLLSTVFLGMASGLMIYGPLSDTYGRKKIMLLGMSVFVLGTIISLISVNFESMLIGRFIQGFGAASCRVIAMAMIRDKYEGNEMAKIMSLITTVFIIVPAIAPSIGQAILLFSHWRAIFVFLLIVSCISVCWVQIRQEETLCVEKRRRFSFKNTLIAIKETVNNPVSRSYTLISGIVFSGFVGYLNSAQQILQIQYQLGNHFSIVFGVLALCLGIAALINVRLLNSFGMIKVCTSVLLIYSVISLGFCMFVLYSAKPTPLPIFLCYLAFAFLSFGLLIGNFNTLALKPLGHIAGTAVSVVSSIQTLLSVVIGSLIGWFYNNSIVPLVVGFTVSALVALFMLYRRVSVDNKAI